MGGGQAAGTGQEQAGDESGKRNQGTCGHGQIRFCVLDRLTLPDIFSNCENFVA
jgi:hypothetical protein